MAKFKLVDKLDHIYTEKYGGDPPTDWYLLKCGHIVARKNTDMTRKKCRCYYCCGKPYFMSPLPTLAETLDRYKNIIPDPDSLVSR